MELIVPGANFLFGNMNHLMLVDGSQANMPALEKQNTDRVRSEVYKVVATEQSWWDSW